MARRTLRQRAATAALVARNAGRRTTQIVVAAPRRAARRVSAGVRTIVQTVRAPRRARRAGLALARGGGVVALAQAKIVPGVVGGYLVGMAEEHQRKAHAASVSATPASKGALIKDPDLRLLAEAATLAFIASRTQGIVRDAAVGASGAVGALYRMYHSKDGSNPVDDYAAAVKAGQAGI